MRFLAISRMVKGEVIPKAESVMITLTESWIQ